MSQINAIRMGADPEVFVRRTGGSVVPVTGLIGGTKEFPLIVDIKREGIGSDAIGNYAVQEDGVALEFNIPAVSTPERFKNAINAALTYCKKDCRDKGLEMVFSASHKFKKTDLESPQARRIGCTPDKDAYAEDPEKDRDPFSPFDFGEERYAGGHLHVAYNHEKLGGGVPQHVFARYLDLFIGLPSIFHDKQEGRRKFYGRAGLYRAKAYGLEYRSLSNFWLRDNYRYHLNYLAQTVFDLGIIANTKANLLRDSYEQVPWRDVKDAMDQENTDMAEEIHRFCSGVLKLPMRYFRELSMPSLEGYDYSKPERIDAVLVDRVEPPRFGDRETLRETRPAVTRRTVRTQVRG